MKYFLAVDIGASSGRHFITWKNENDELEYKEIFRFKNGLEKRNNHLCWNLEGLFTNIKEGLKKCKKQGVIPESLGIDTWGCDFVLLDSEGKILGDSVAYRDNRTEGYMEKLNSLIGAEELYQRTGIQRQPFNTIYQLMSIKDKNPEILEKANNFLMIPDYFHYLLSGQISNEYTNATTTALVNTETKDWDWELIKLLGLPEKIFMPILKPGKKIGRLSEEIEKEVGFSCDIVLPCTHDTGSAIAAIPLSENKSGENKPVLYISSGTWSLLGSELFEANKNHKSFIRNYTNEGGYGENGFGNRYRFLKNIMGLWMLQSVKKELEERSANVISFDELDKEAKESCIKSIVACNDKCFLAPSSMIDAVQSFCQKRKLRVPQTAGELARVIYESLARCYAEAIKELEDILNCSFEELYIVGGGSKSALLNLFTERCTGLKIIAGPSEATAIGNCLIQMLCNGEYKNLAEARQAVRNKVLKNGGK